MKFYQNFIGVKPYLQLLTLLIMSVVFLIVGSFVSMMFMPLFSSADNILQGVTNVAENVSFMRFLQASTQIFYMFIPSVLFGFMFYPSIVEFFKMRFSRKQITITLCGVAVFVAMIPFVDCVTRWNNAMHLPESMATLEATIRNMGLESERMMEMFLTENGSVWIFFANIVVMALIPAVSEEFIYRGAIQQTCAKWFDNHHIAIIVTAAVFSLIHFDLFNFIPRFIMGIVLGYLFYFSGSIWTSVCVHFFNNGVIVVMYYFTGYNSTESIAFDNTILNVILVILSLVVSAVLVYVGIRSIKKNVVSDSQINSVE